MKGQFALFLEAEGEIENRKFVFWTAVNNIAGEVNNIGRGKSKIEWIPGFAQGYWTAGQLDAI